MRAFGAQCRPFILDSAQSNDGLGEWSFFGAEPFHTLRGVSLSELREAMGPFACDAVDLGIPFVGGAVGYFAYDYGRRFEEVPSRAKDDRCIADMEFGLYDGVAALDHGTGRLYLLARGVSEPADLVIARMRGWLDGEAPLLEMPRTVGEWEWNLSEEAFCAAVERVREYISQGDVYQVNLSRRARCRFEGDGLGVYEALRVGNPAPYSAYLRMGDLELISTSPEQFLKKRGPNLITRPIKGTRPRGEMRRKI